MRRIAFLALLLSPRAWAAPSHPLDPLDQAEISRAVEVLRQAGKLGPDMLFPALSLQEPPKAEVLAFEPGKPFRREAFAVLYDRRGNKTFEAVVDVAGTKLSSWKELPGVQPPVLLSEFEELPAVVKADPRWREALARRGISDVEDAAVDIWGYGTPDKNAASGARLLRALAYMKGKGRNFYARPIEGLTAIVNANERKVESVIDTGALPIPPQASELDDASLGPARPALKPLNPVQRQGASFTVEGNLVRWDKWRFRFAMHPREGLVLYQVGYQDGDKLRPILYRASLAEMMVPYGHNDPNWTFRNAFDEGEYGIGRYSGSLEPGADVPANARLFDAAFADDFGKPYSVKNAVAVYEKDGGILWKHFDMYHGGNYSRRGRDLVISFVTTISNYDYGMSWIFHQDGRLELLAELTGIMLAKGSDASGHDHGSGDLRFAHKVAPNVVAPHHQHFFNFRVDLDVDGATDNGAAELNAAPLPKGKDNPALNAFTMEETVLKSEREAQRDLNLASQRKWKVFNAGRTNDLGEHPGFILVPGENSIPMLHKDSPLRRRGAFINHPVWITRYAEGELYSAGPYPSQSLASDGLPRWTAADRPLVNQDVVLWYTFGITHAPRPEEWPVMPAHRAGFQLIPAGFFPRNPSLDVPNPKEIP